MIYKDMLMNIRVEVMVGYIFAELPTWEMVFLKSGTESEVPECLFGSVSSPQYVQQISTQIITKFDNCLRKRLKKVDFGPKLRIRCAG